MFGLNVYQAIGKPIGTFHVLMQDLFLKEAISQDYITCIKLRAKTSHNWLAYYLNTIHSNWLDIGTNVASLSTLFYENQKEIRPTKFQIQASCYASFPIEVCRLRQAWSPSNFYIFVKFCRLLHLRSPYFYCHASKHH